MPQQVVGLHDQPGRAEAALHGPGIEERLLYRMQHVRVLRSGQALDRDHVAVGRLPGRDQACAHRHVVEEDRA